MIAESGTSPRAVVARQPPLRIRVTPFAALANHVSKSPGEFHLIERLLKRLGPGRRAILGPGDDCAILPATRARQLLTIDSMVEDVHFKLAWGTPEALGARALTVNLSDIAAMGGKPTVCVVNLAVRDGLGMRFFDRMYEGLRKAAARAEVEVVGGNITRAGALAITIALLGEVRGAALRRDAARPGDTIYVTGTLGDAAAGLRSSHASLADGSAPAPPRASSWSTASCNRPRASRLGSPWLASSRRLPRST